MKYIYLFLILLGLSAPAKAQVLITGPTGYSWYWYGYDPSGGPGFITFLVQNTNTTPILLTDVGIRCYSTNAHELWYSATSTTGIPGAISSSNPAWNKISTVSTPSTSTGIVNNFFTGVNLVIPASTTYRFAVLAHSLTSTTMGVYFGSTTNPATPFTMTPSSSGGVSLDVNNAYWGYANSGAYGTGYGFYGSITFSPCPYTASGLGANNIKSTSANVFWNPVLSGSVGFDYAVTTSSTPPTSGFTATTNTSASITGLTPATAYYLHVRNKCSSTSFSGWVTYMFRTPPPCAQPVLTISDIKETSAKITWKTEPHALNYEFVVDQNTADPTAPGKLSTGTETPTGLTEGTTYYVHVKMNCASGETSGWVLDSFTTSFVCRPPVLTVDYEHIDRALVYWQPKKGAYEYEYEVSQSPTPLGDGTAIKNTSFLAYPLKDGQVYYFHVRTACDDRGYKSKSEWGTISFRTFPTSVNTLSGKDMGIIAYPNPVKQTLTVKNDGLKPEGVISVMDISGKTIYTSRFEGKTHDMDMSSYANGVYLLKYVSADGGNQIIRVTKQ